MLMIAIGGCGLAVAIWRRAPAAVVVAVLVIAFGRGTLAEQRYRGVTPGQHAGWVKLVTDPEPGRFGTNAEVALADGRRVQLSAGWEHSRIDRLSAGSSVYVEGHLRSIDPTDWARSRHLVGRLNVDDLGASVGVRWWGRPSQWMRGVVQAGADRLPREWEPLYTGLVIGDDRFQSKGQQARFRAAGLSHLLAVSGQNVAFVLAVAAPLLGRLGWWPRFYATLGLLVVFAVATRLEPSVLRATATAIVSVMAVTNGARASGVRALMTAGTALVIIDPFLVWSIGFRLSVAASLGILVIGPVIDKRLPGSSAGTGSWWRTPLTITLAAQLGVTPLLAAVFGPVAVVSVPANLLAGWAAGFVMTWGLTGGVAAALFGDVFGSVVGGVLQWPAVAAMWWIDAVASAALAVPSPMIGGPLSLLAIGAGVIGWLSGPEWPTMRRIGYAAALLVLAMTVPRPPEHAVDLGGAARYWPAGQDSGSVSVLVVSSRADDRLIDSIVERRLGVIDVVVVEGGGRTMSALVTELRDVTTIGTVLAPPQHRVVGGRRLLAPITLEVGDATLTVAPLTDDRIEVEVRQPP